MFNVDQQHILVKYIFTLFYLFKVYMQKKTHKHTLIRRSLINPSALSHIKQNRIYLVFPFKMKDYNIFENYILLLYFYKHYYYNDIIFQICYLISSIYKVHDFLTMNTFATEHSCSNAACIACCKLQIYRVGVNTKQRQHDNSCHVMLLYLHPPS